jgi:hypothetical protein
MEDVVSCCCAGSRATISPFIANTMSVLPMLPLPASADGAAVVLSPPADGAAVVLSPPAAVVSEEAPPPPPHAVSIIAAAIAAATNLAFPDFLIDFLSSFFVVTDAFLCAAGNSRGQKPPVGSLFFTQKNRHV